MRLQILELPYDSENDLTPFALIISEAPRSVSLPDAEHLRDFRDHIGATGVFVTPESVEIGPPEQPSVKVADAHIDVTHWQADADVMAEIDRKLRGIQRGGQ